MGPGAVVIELALLGVGGWLMSYIARGVGKGQLARLIHMATVFVGLMLVLGTVLRALAAVSNVLGIG